MSNLHFSDWPTVLGAVTAGRDLSRDESEAMMAEILAGDATHAQIAAVIVALRMKGETVDELAGMVRAMQSAATPLSMPDGCIDLVGVGGAPARRVGALNVSTMACFVAAAAGAVVCKHGNRKASSTSGSFDFLEALGVNIELSPTGLEGCVREVGVGFAFARAFHQAMRYAGPVRADIGIPTVFNVLGPLSHPARLRRQVIGVPDASMADRMIRVLIANGVDRAWVVAGHGELDEMTTAGPTKILATDGVDVTSFTIDPADLGIEPPVEGALMGGDAAANAVIVRRVFDGEHGACRDIVALNAAAGLVVAGMCDDIEAGLAAATAAIDDGGAAAKLKALIDFSNETDR